MVDTEHWEAGKPHNRCLSVEIVSQPTESPDLIDFWKHQAQSINSDPDFFLTITALRDKTSSPFIVLVRENGAPITALICRLEATHLPTRVAYFTIANFTARSITTVYKGLIGRDTEIIRREILDALLKEIRSGTADILTLSMIAPTSTLMHSINTLNIRKWRVRKSIQQCHFRLSVPGNPEEILMSKPRKTRKKLKYYARKTETELPEFKISKITEEDNLERLMESLENVASKTYQRGLGVGFHNNQEWRDVFKLGFRRRWLEVWTLSNESKCITFLIGMKYKGQYLVYAKAFDPDYANVNVGTYLQLKVLEDIALQGECKILDYGFGDANYKRQFSTESWLEGNIIIADASMKNFLIMHAAHICDSLDRFLRTQSERLQLTQRVKRVLRSHKAQVAQERNQDL